MTTTEKNQKIEDKIERLHAQAVSKHKQNQLDDALALYLQSIELDKIQSEWIYANAITVAAQIGSYDVAKNLLEQARDIYHDSEDIYRASGIFFHKINNIDKAIESYQKCISLEPKQPEWVYAKLIELLIQSDLSDHAEEIKQAAIKEFPDSENFNKHWEFNIVPKDISSNKHNGRYSDLEKVQVLGVSLSREMPKSIEKCVDIRISKLRRKLTDSAIVERYAILLNQLLCNIKEGKKEMDVDALVQCLAEIKTDIHYLKTKVINPPAETVDPQAKQNVELEKIIGLNKPMLIKCELKERIVGSGWYDAEEHGRWSGPGTVSSVVLPYPVAGNYKFEMVVRGEAKSDLLQTLKVNINDQVLETSIIQRQNSFFPAVVRGDITIAQEENQSFLAIDLIIDETVIPLDTDSRLIGLLVERISLIPHHAAVN